MRQNSKKRFSLRDWRAVTAWLFFIILGLIIAVFFYKRGRTEAPAWEYQIGRMFTIQELWEDFEILEKTLTEAHGNLYAQIDPPDFKKTVQTVQRKLDRPMTEIEFYCTLSPLVSAIRCGHTQLMPSQKYEAFCDMERGFLPYVLVVIHKRLFIADELVPAKNSVRSYEILNINGRTTQSVMDTILPNLSRDGTIQTQKQKKLGKNLSLYLNLYVERAERYELHILAPDGETRVIEEDAITGKQYRDKMSVVSPGGSSHLVEFSLWSKHKTARLRMKTFYTVSLKKKGIQYKKYFKNLFRLIEEDEIENLVIDIRGNAGGSLYLAADLLAYLLDGRFRFLERYQLSPNLRLTHKQHIARDPFVSFKWLVTLKREEWRSFPWNRLLKPQKPKRRFRFKGKIYVLIDGETFSAASMFAALLRGRVNTIFVGEETGGSTCGNGVSPIHLILPHSRLRVQIPFGYIRLAVPEDTECSRGVIPDFVVDWAPEDLISNRDPVLDFALGMITQ